MKNNYLLGALPFEREHVNTVHVTVLILRVSSFSGDLLSKSLQNRTKACSGNSEVEAQLEHQMWISSYLLLKIYISAGLPKLDLKPFVKNGDLRQIR